MAENSYPIVVNGNWKPEHLKSLKNKLVIHFQSKKRSQGGDCIVEVNENNSVTVRFKSSNVRDDVLSKTDHVIVIDKDEIKLKLSKPSDTVKDPDNSKQSKPSDATKDPANREQLKEQASGFQEPIQTPTESDLDVKNFEESYSVVLENVTDDTTKKYLSLFVENVSGMSLEKDFCIDLILELNTAVVTFTSATVAEKFLKESRTNRKFKDFNLKARALEKSKSVRVENLPSEANKMFLDLYFEKCGGQIQEIITFPLEQAAVITFLNEEGKEKVLKMEHKICDVLVKIYPYYKSLDTALYGSNRPTLKLPEPFKVNVHPAIREFLIKEKKQISIINEKLSTHFCQINVDKPEFLISPDPALLKQKGATRKHVDDWRKNASDAFEIIMTNYTAFEFQVMYPLWIKVQSDIKKELTDLVFTDFDVSKGVLTVAGMTHDLNGLRPVIDKMLDPASSQIERESRSVTDDIEITPAMYSLLQQDGQNAVSPQLNLNYNKNMNRLSLVGPHSEILTFKNFVLEKEKNMKQMPLKINRSLWEFLRSVDPDEMSKDLFVSHGINAVYTLENADLVLTGSTERSLSEAQKILNMVLQTENITVEDREVFALPQWHDLNKQLESLHNTPKKRTVFINTSQGDKVTVSGFKDPVTEVSQTLRDFIEKHSRIEDGVRVKSHAVVEFIKERKTRDWQHFLKSHQVTVQFDSKGPWIKLSGEQMFVQPARMLFKKMADDLFTDTLIIEKAGAKKYFKDEGQLMLSLIMKEKRFIIVLQEDYMLEEEEFENDNKASLEDFLGYCEVRMPGGVTVTVKKADICKLNVDAVVNPANEDLQHIGGLALALLQAAGPDLQDLCNKHIKLNGSLKPGDAIITDAGRLPCKYVVHAVGPRYNSSDRSGVELRLKSAVRGSLTQASLKDCSSIAIPVISSGIFGCPVDLCTETIAKEVRDFIEYQNRGRSQSKLTEILLVDNNANTVKSMAQAVEKHFAEFSPKINFPHQSKPSGLGGDAHKGQGNHGQGRGYHEQRYQEFENHNYEPKIHGTRDFERRTQWREESNFSGGRSEEFDGLTVLETKTTQFGLQISLRKGNIQDGKTDVIVNTITEDMDLNKGAISKAILKAAGHRIQTELRSNARSSSLRYGAIVITDSYSLKCRRVFHVLCPFWTAGTGCDMVLIQIIRDCLKKADDMQMSSVSFPAIGTGNLGFPKDLVAEIILGEVQKFTPQNLKEITVILHPSDKAILNCFTRIFQHEIQNTITKGAHHHHNMPKPNDFDQSAKASGHFGKVSTFPLEVINLQIGQVTLEVSSGDITKEKTHAIVNSSNPTFSLKTGVSKAILDAAGSQVEQECLQFAKTHIQQKEIVTSAGRLSCRNIIHIIGRNRPSEIKEIVLSVLNICETNGLSSVAFPALGTGQGGANPADVADAMVDAVVDFVKKKKPANLKLVKFIIFQTNIMINFHNSIQKRSGEKVEEEKGVMDKIKDWTKELICGESPRNEEMVVEKMEPVVFQLCGETPQDLKKASDMINDLIKKEFLNTKIRDPGIGFFTNEDVEILKTIQKELAVSIKLERTDQDPVILLDGRQKDVHTAESRIRDMIRQVGKNESKKQEALLHSSMVEWKYRESGHNLKCFDMLTNLDLEKAFLNKNTNVKINIDNDEYTVDLPRLQATGRWGRLIEIHRVDLNDSQFSYPSRWDKMTGGQTVLVKLTAGSAEYIEVEKEFRRTGLTSKIIKIERIQNSSLWKNYITKKEELEDKNRQKNNVRFLYHGTGPDKTRSDQINHNGFHRRNVGKHGNGTYFAVDPRYVAQRYCPADANGHKRMYLARVLVGDFTQGKSGMLVPPGKSSSSADLYNSVTDDINNPRIFVIFNNVQAYPEYLITFN